MASVVGQELDDRVVTVALVPVKLIVCVEVVPLSLIVNVAVSSVPEAAEGLKVSVTVQLPPLAITRLSEQVPAPVFDQSPAFVPVIVKYGLSRVRLPDPVHAAMSAEAQLFTDTVKTPDVVPTPCFPVTKTGDGMQFA